MPTACVINDSRRVIFLDSLADSLCVKLSPRLVKRNPTSDRSAVIKMVYRLKRCLFVLSAAFLIVNAEPFVMAVRNASDKHIRQHADEEHINLLCAAYHVLPNDHAQLIAMVIPASRFDFYMLSEHVEAEILHLFDIKNHRFIAGRSHSAVRPIALVEKSCLEIRFVI